MLELGPGFTAITGETGAGKTMVVTALGLLLGGRADSGAVRTGARAARVEGLVRVGAAGRRSPSTRDAGRRAAARSRTRRLVLARQISAEGRSRAFVGGASVPVSALAALADPLVAVHGQSDQHRLLQPGGPARRARPLRRRPVLRAARALRGRLRPRCAGPRRELAEVVESARERAQRGRPAAVRARPRSRRSTPQPGEDAALAAEESRLGFADTLRAAAEQARECLVRRGRRAGRARPPSSAARGLLDGRPRARPGGRRAGRPAGRGQLPALRRGRRRGVVRLRVDTDPVAAGRGLRASRRAGRADPEVRRDRRRRAGLGRARRRPAARARRHRRADRDAAGAATELRAELAALAAELSAARVRGRDAAGRRWSPPSWRALAMPHAEV